MTREQFEAFVKTSRYGMYLDRFPEEMERVGGEYTDAFTQFAWEVNLENERLAEEGKSNDTQTI